MGKNIRQVSKVLDIGSIGIGALIVFIAMVLVAGIAASVLIQTSITLESQAMVTGAETTDEISSGIAVFDILGYCASPGTTDISKILIGVRPRAGSDEIDLSLTYVELSDSNTKVIFNYTNSYYVDDSVGDDDVFSLNCFPDDGVTDASRFGIIVVEDADNSLTSETPAINRGDKVYLGINATGCFNDLTERTDFCGMVAPEEGSPGVIQFITPSSYRDNVIDLL
jgi:flagellin FlaB